MKTLALLGLTVSTTSATADVEKAPSVVSTDKLISDSTVQVNQNIVKQLKADINASVNITLLEYAKLAMTEKQTNMVSQVLLTVKQSK